MNNCSHLYLLSAIACQLFECMEEKELEVLAADLVALGDMLESIFARAS